jgi:hypothetical protein
MITAAVVRRSEGAQRHGTRERRCWKCEDRAGVEMKTELGQ